MSTQIQSARSGAVTGEIGDVSRREGVDPDVLRAKVAGGNVVIPANRIHLQSGLQPAGIGRLLSTKVNANIGTSSENCSIEGELDKLHVALGAGADAVMDLSTAGDLDEIRAGLLAECKVPFGTVPLYQVAAGGRIEDITCDRILEVIRRQAEQGVDFFTIHAGVLREHLPLLEKRVGGIVSRGGAIMAKWMLDHNRQNPMYEIFDQMAAIMAEYDVCFSLGDGLRPGAGADAGDQAQLAELHTLGELVHRARELGCQVMVEGPGHVPFDQIQYNMEIARQVCDDAPFYVLGPLVTDIAPGYDHITSAIGGTAAAYWGASFLCYVTPTEHLGLPGTEDVRLGVISSRIAAHAADVARGLSSAVQADRRISVARSNLDWESQISCSIDPARARQICQKNASRDADYCSMCGQSWCSIRISRQVRQSGGWLAGRRPAEQ